MTHRTHLVQGVDVVQLICDCGWADAPWSTAGLDHHHLALVEEWIDEAHDRHARETLTA